MSNWMDFIEGPEHLGSASWRVQAKKDGTVLGWVYWYSAWRRLCFFPEGERLFDAQCLRDLAGFLETKTREQKDRG